MHPLADAARAAATAAEALPVSEQRDAFLAVVRTHVHAVVQRLAVEDTDPGLDVTRQLAAVVRDLVPVDVDQELHPRARVFVRLLRLDALEPAWTLALDNASGVLRPERAVAMWAGGSFLSHELPLPTMVDDGHVYAWLPGFRDPRWSVADEVYSIDDDSYLRGQLDEAAVVGGRLELRGSAYVRMLDADQDDRIVVEFTGPGGAVVGVDATRARRTDLVRTSGPELTRLAWAGWHLALDVERLLDPEGAWTVTHTLHHRGLVRSEPVGLRRGPLADARLIGGTVQWDRSWLRLDRSSDGGLTVRTGRLGRAARLVPAGARAGLRSLRR